MARITAELLRRRAEHNGGCLADVRELALHAQGLERIELLGRACRRLRVLYLQNNLISRIEALRRLKVEAGRDGGWPALGPRARSAADADAQV